MSPELSDGSVLGQRVQGALRQLETFELPPRQRIRSVVYTSDEVTSLCPITGQPDWYTVKITLFGPRRGIESKSLKLYLQSFRDDGAFCEEFAATIAEDVYDAVSTHCNVEVTQKSRGGVSIVATASVGER